MKEIWAKLTSNPDSDGLETSDFFFFFFFRIFPTHFWGPPKFWQFSTHFWRPSKLKKKFKYLYLHSPLQSYPSLTLHGVVFVFLWPQAKGVVEWEPVTRHREGGGLAEIWDFFLDFCITQSSMPVSHVWSYICLQVIVNLCLISLYMILHQNIEHVWVVSQTTRLCTTTCDQVIYYILHCIIYCLCPKLLIYY